MALSGQDVNPATTVHSVQIASRLGGSDADIQATRENYLAGIAGLQVQMLQDGGQVTGFELAADTAPADRQAGLAAFCATALFNSLYHRKLNADFSAVTSPYFNIDVPENPEAGPRSGTLFCGGHPVIVAQDGQQCAIADYGVEPITTSFNAAGGTGTIEMSAPDQCPWDAVTDSEWITIVSGATGIGGGTVTYAIAENTSVARAGNIIIAGTQHMVVQSDAATNQPFALTIQGEGV